MTITAKKGHTATIRDLNDKLRTTGVGGRVVYVGGIVGQGPADCALARSAVAMFTAFYPDNDPWNEHDFAAIKVPRVGDIMFKIDYYGANGDMDHGSEDPADPAKTTRVLTIFLAEDY